MIVFIVTLSNYASGRYIDSIWVERGNAVRRVEDLTAELQRCGYRVGKGEAFCVWIEEARVNDAERGEAKVK